MKRYRRIEITAFQRRVTIVTDESPLNATRTPPLQREVDVTRGDIGPIEKVEIESPEGQLIVAEAIRSLQQRLLLAERGKICDTQLLPAPSNARRHCPNLTLRSLCELVCKAVRVGQKRK